MHKAVCVAAILLAAFAFTSGSKPAGAAANSLPSPVVLAKGKLVNQTAAIPTTTMFTPTQDGLYRITVYATLTTSNLSSNSSWGYGIGWTDDAGSANQGSVLIGPGAQLGPFTFYGITTGGTVLVVEAKSGIPVTYNVSQGGEPDGTAYSLYWTVEKME
jgi:hypothetical protein